MTETVSPIEQAVAALHDAALQRRLALVDDERADRHVEAEVRQATRRYSFLASAFRL